MSLLPASIKRIGSKATKKRWRHQFPHYKSMGDFCCHGNISSLPVILHIKFDQEWPTGIRDIQVGKCKIFVTQGQVSGLIRPEIKLFRAFMPALVTSNFDDDSKKK